MVSPEKIGFPMRNIPLEQMDFSFLSAFFSLPPDAWSLSLLWIKDTERRIGEFQDLSARNREMQIRLCGYDLTMKLCSEDTSRAAQVDTLGEPWSRLIRKKQDKDKKGNARRRVECVSRLSFKYEGASIGIHTSAFVCDSPTKTRQFWPASSNNGTH